MTQNTIDTILQDPELIRKLDVIERTSTGSSNAYASRQATLEFCRMMWRLVGQEGTNPFKEMHLLNEILSSEEFVSLVTKPISSKIIEIGSIYYGEETRQAIIERLGLPEDTNLEERFRDPEFFDNREVQAVLREWLFDQMPNDRDYKINVVDLGCGNGDKARIMIANLPFSFINYFPIDISPSMSAVALHNLRTILNQDTIPVVTMNALNIKTEDILRLAQENNYEREERVGSIFKKFEVLENIVSAIFRNPNLRDFVKYCKERYEYLGEKYRGNSNRAIPTTPEDIDDLEFYNCFSMTTVFDSRISDFLMKLERQKLDVGGVISADRPILTFLDRYLSITEPLLDYFVEYFSEVKNILENRDFNRLVKTDLYSHELVFSSTFLTRLGSNLYNEEPFSEINWFYTTNRREFSNSFRNVRNHLNNAKQSQNSRFGAVKLKQVLEACIGKTYIDDYDLHDKDKVCLVPESGITLDFFDFDKVYKSIAYLTSINPGRNIFLLLGQTLGNFTLEERRLLLSNIYAKLKPNDLLLVGVDLCPDQVLTSDARQFRIDRIKSEYKEGEPFARSCLRTDQTNIKYVVDFDETTNDVVINFEDKGTTKPFFRSHKFSYQEIQDLLTITGFNLIGGRAYVPQTIIDYGKEYAVILCQKVEK